MIAPNRPVGYTAPVYSAPQVPGAAAAPVPVVVNAGLAPQAAPGILSTLGSMVSGVFNFIKNLFSKLFGSAGTTPVTPGTVPTAPGAAADDATLAQQYGLANNPQNIAAFREVLARTSAEPGVVGPGSSNREAVLELQQLLSSWGFPIPATGAFDPATADAVMSFKAKHGLTETFTFANGQPGTTPFVDAKTKAKMIELLNGPPPGTAGTPTPGLPPIAPPMAPPPPPPPAPVPPPVAPPVAPPPPPPAPPVVSGTPTPTPTPGTPPVTAGALTAEQQGIATQAGILATPENFQAFMTAAQKLETEPGVIGPGLNETVESCNELQTLLKTWGYTVDVTGKFDEKTVAAVLKFKRDNNLTQAYKMADNTAGVHPYIDAATKAFMIKKLGG